MTEQKIEAFRRDATAEDVAKVMRGEKVEARFRDYEHQNWWFSVLNGWRDERDRSWLDSDGAGWKHCQVYDPPQWFLDKPDPGEGYRLLEKFPPEDLQKGDEIWACDNSWCYSWRANNDEKTQKGTNWYRRRIEPVKVESRSKDYIPSGWAKLSEDEPRLASDAYWSQGASEWCLIGDNRVEYANRDKWPAIRRVENQISMKLMADCCYTLPSGHSICVTETGFEVLLCRGRT